MRVSEKNKSTFIHRGLVVIIALGTAAVQGIYSAATGSGKPAYVETPDPNATDYPEHKPVNAPKAIIPNAWLGFDVIVGQTYHVEEGFTNDAYSGSPETDAAELIQERQLGNANGIKALYSLSDYRHYGNDDETAPQRCKIVDQDPIEIDHDSNHTLNYNNVLKPIHCTLDDGRDFYATGLNR